MILFDKHFTAMARHYITQELVDELTPKDKLYDITAIGYPGFGVRVLPSGRINYFYRYRIKNSVRMAILGQASWMNYQSALHRYKKYKDLKDQGIEPKGVNPTAEEADFLFVELFMFFDRGKELPLSIRNEPTIEEFADHFRVHPAAVKKLAAYDQLKLFKSGEDVRVIPYPVTIKTSCRNGLQIR
jgi:hypothetical protein